MDFKKFIPHLIAAGILLGVALVFFLPNAIGGKVLPQPDNDKARAMQTEIKAYQEKEGNAPLWTNSAFAGMPAYQIYSPQKGNLIEPVYRAVFLWQDASAVWIQVLVAMLMTYLLLAGALRTDWRVAVFGALAYGITSYNIDILEAGHSTKMLAMALTPGMLAGAIWAFNGRWLMGGGVLALFTAMQIFANHVQITYYTLMVLGIYGLARLVDTLIEGNWGSYLKGGIAVVLALGLGFGANASRLLTTMEYSQETIRGASELSTKAAKGDGLDPDYLFGWSYGKAESMTLFIPHFAGGGASESYGDSKVFKAVSKLVPPGTPKGQLEQQVGTMYYTGDQPFVGTAIYFGAILFFLFGVGLFTAPTIGTRIWLIISALFMISLAWGKNFGLNFFWLENLPMFNKFRAVSMALGPAQLCFALMGAMALQGLVSDKVSVQWKKIGLIAGLAFTAVMTLLALVLFRNVGVNDKEMLAGNNELLALLEEDRSARFRGDLLRSLMFILLAAAVLWFYVGGKLKGGIAVLLVAALALFDQWGVCTRTISSDKYTAKRNISAPKPEEHDLRIKQDKDLHYRVLDLSRGGIPSNWITSYHHKSIGGYHAAKLQRFQEVVDTFLGQNIAENLHVLGMMNTKYLVSQRKEIIPLPQATGNAWFVKHFEVVESADREFNALHRLNPKDSAVVQKSYASALEGFSIQADTTASIRLTAYHPDRLEYEYSAKTPQFAVFSEMYYPPAKGWKTYLNGQPAKDFFKVDYLLRGMVLPAGEKAKLEMRFEPDSYSKGGTIALISSLLTLLLFLGGTFLWYRRNPMEVPERIAETAAPASNSRSEVEKAKKKK